jgi:benzoate-CoA ligase family protein
MDINAATFLVDRHAPLGNSARVAIVTPASEVTYGQLAVAVDRAANYLQRHLGVLPRQRVVLYLFDSAEFIYFFLAAMKIGAVAVPVSTFCSTDQLAFYLRDTRARVLVTHSDLDIDAAGAARSLRPRLAHTVYVDRDDWQAEEGSIEAFPVDAEDSAFWLYTSGSTGAQKGVVHRHGAILACVRGYCQDVLALSASDRCYSASKLFFAYGLGNSLFFPFSVGAATLLCPHRSEPDNVIGFIRNHRPTLFFAVPTLYNQLLAASQVDAALFDSVRMCVSAGELLPEPLFQRWSQRTGKPVYDGIGSTESMHIFCSNRPGRCRPGTSGVPVKGYQLKLVDADEVEVPVGQPGQLWVRGNTIAKGYWDRYDAARAAFRGEWLVTGDVYEKSADGYFHHLGRKDDVFKVSGLWVSPGEVEEALLACGYAREAAIVAVSNAAGLTSAKAFVVLGDSPEVRDTAAARVAILAHLRERLPHYKVPGEIEFLAALPKTATGKVLRGELRRRHETSTAATTAISY